MYREKFAVTRNTGAADDGDDTVSFEELVRLDYDAGLSGAGLRFDPSVPWLMSSGRCLIF